MRHNRTKENIRKHTTKTFINIVAVIGVVIASSINPLQAQSVDDLQRQIDAMNNQISESQRQINSLRERADTLENRLEILKAEARQLQGQIDETRKEIAVVQGEIKTIEAELARTRELIQENAKVLYKEGSPTTIEILFSSSNFSEFISRQEYLSSAKDSMNEAAETAVRLKDDLSERQTELEVTSERLNGQQDQLTQKQRQQESLIAETRGEESRYQRLVQRQQSEKESLEEQQRAAYAAIAAQARQAGQFTVTSGGGSYPWASGPYPCWSSNCVDPWGLYFRECVSYTAWKVASTGRFVPHFAGAGHAKQWPATAQRHGIPNGTTPRVGSVAIDMHIGAFGHSMYVEAVHGNGTITVSEYNVLPGQYSERVIPAAGLVYVYF